MRSVDLFLGDVVNIMRTGIQRSLLVALHATWVRAVHVLPVEPDGYVVSR